MSNTIRWQELTPEQRDALVAKEVMGLELKTCDGEVGEQSNSPDGWFCLKCGYEGCWGDSFDHRELPRHYTTDMNAAWLVLQRMVRPPKTEQDHERRFTFISELDGPIETTATWTPERLCHAAWNACQDVIEEGETPA